MSFDYTVPIWPTYEMTLWNLDFGLAMRHYIGTKNTKFSIANIMMNYVWESEVSFEKEEVINGELCDKWVVRGNGVLARIQGVKQELWFAKNSPYYHVVKYKKNYFLASSRWRKQQYVLQNIQEMTAAEWLAHTNDLTEKAKTKFGY